MLIYLLLMYISKSLKLIRRIILGNETRMIASTVVEAVMQHVQNIKCIACRN